MKPTEGSKDNKVKCFDSEGLVPVGGVLTKRDVIAKDAMAAIISGMYSNSQMTKIIGASAKSCNMGISDFVSLTATQYADSLITQLEKHK